MIYPRGNPHVIGVAPSLNNILYNNTASTSYQQQLNAYQLQQQQTQQQLVLQQQLQQEHAEPLPIQQIQPQLPYHYPQQYYPDTKIENPMFIESTTILVPPNQAPQTSTTTSISGCSSCGGSGRGSSNTSSCSSGSGGGSIPSSPSTTVSASSSGSAAGPNIIGNCPSSSSSMQGFGSIGSSSNGHGNNSGGSSSNKKNNSSVVKCEIGGIGIDRLISGKRSMSNSEVRMTPRPAKTPAWSFPPLMSIPSPIDDPSSCSDNASDHSDKIESMSNNHSSSHTNNHHNNSGNSGTNHNPSSHQKNRKRKMGSFSGNSGNNGNQSSSGSDNNHHSQIKENGLNSGAGNGNSGSSNSNSNAQASLWADAESLAADFDGSLSGLGADLSSASYDMSEALLALPTIYNHNRGLSNNITASSSSSSNHNANSSNSNNNNNASSSSPHQTSSSATGSLRDSELTPLAASHHHGGSSVSLPGDFQFNRNSPTFQHANNHASSLDCERRFQYVLAAATSIATKMNEETLTYLNQGQPYEIKLKKLGELTSYRGTVFRTVVRLCFHDRRLQFSEREQIALWEYSHPRDRILQVDVPLSYGVTMMTPPSDLSTNAVSFLWEPLKEVGLYVKVNCISTEFTPKKHGGEKGVPFRMMIETYSHPDNVRLHAGACQVKVFKLKGADRKHKQDREKILKKTTSEQAKLQPSYDCTVLSDISLESLDSPPPSIQNQVSSASILPSPPYANLEFPVGDGGGGESPDHTNAGSVGNAVVEGNNADNCGGGPNIHFSAHFSSESVRRWLVRNRFTATKTLWDFNGLDLLRLNKEELIEMCGLAEGIRLYNALHYKITFFVTLGNRNQHSDIDENNSESSGDETTFHPVCLSSPSTNELLSVLNSIFKANSTSTYNNHRQQQQVERLFLSVTANSNSRIRVLLNEQLLSTLKDQSAFRVYKNGGDVSIQLIE